MREQNLPGDDGIVRWAEGSDAILIEEARPLKIGEGLAAPGALDPA